jgi:hypothetical protein
VDRQTRKQLKTDKFAQDLGNTFSFLNEHRTESIRYGLIGLAVIILGVGYYFYSRSQATAREAALEKAMQIDPRISISPRKRRKTRPAPRLSQSLPLSITAPPRAPWAASS